MTIRPTLVKFEGGAGTRATGTFSASARSAEIILNPDLKDDDILVYDAKKRPISSPVFITLGHELIHALHITTGKVEFGPAKSPDFVAIDRGEEEQTIKTGRPSENDLRKAFNLPLRRGDEGVDTRP